MIKIDLHMHTGEDPKDGLPYPATMLLDKAAALGYGAIAITLHEQVLEEPRVFEYARSKGVLLIPAVEWTIGGRDVLIYNISQAEAEKILTFDDLRAFRKERGDNTLTIAPHPYYPVGHSLKHEVVRNIDCFDAIEHAQIHLTWLNPNKTALKIAREHGKPVIANSDAHNLWMFGRHYTMVDAPAELPAIFQAIKKGHVRYFSPPITIWECLKMFVFDRVLYRRKGRIVKSFPPS